MGKRKSTLDYRIYDTPSFDDPLIHFSIEMKKNFTSFMKDILELQKLYSKFTKNKKYKKCEQEFIKQALKKLTSDEITYACDFSELGKYFPFSESQHLSRKAREFKKDHKYNLYLGYEYGAVKLFIEDYRSDCVGHIYPVDDFLYYYLFRILEIEEDGKHLKGEDFYYPEDVDNYIPTIVIKDSSQKNVVGDLSRTINEYFPQIILYSSPNRKVFLISIPKHSSIKDINRFSKQINSSHSMFFSTKKDGRPQTKQYQQKVFNREFTKLKKKGYSVDKSCQTISEDFKDEFCGISWTTLKRDYYPVWKKCRGK